MGFYIYFCLYGLIAGVLAKSILPGNDEGGLFSTVALGVIGSICGGYLYSYFGYEIQKGISLSGLTPAVSGAVLILLFYKLILYLKK